MNQPTTQSASVLKTMRNLVPQRRLTYTESLRIAELQANRLLELFAVTGPFVPTEIVTELPRVTIRQAADMPVSGSAHWEEGQWVITLNSAEGNVRRRFSLMHEFKHVLDHTTKSYLYGDTLNDPEAAAHAERAADQFAACVLMPKRWLKSEWFGSRQNLAVSALRLGVSTRALSVRLHYLGLGIEMPRCSRTNQSEGHRSSASGYFRSASMEAVA
jgi:Zn-dependent peptidase ImmA (M78 family)